MRKENDTIEITEDVRIPGTDVILEAGDRIQVLQQRPSKFKENKSDAMKKDKNKKGEIEVTIEDDDDQEIVVGINSGFAYATPPDAKKWVKDQKGFVLV